MKLSEEYVPTSAYEYKERGIGYLQVTHFETQREAYTYLVENNYIEPSEEANDDNGYVSALAQNPWAVSAWYWSKYPKTGNGLSLNQYVVKVMQDEDFVKFSVGLPFVCESFNYGTVTDAADKYLRLIARGKEIQFDTVYNPDLDYDCLSVAIDGNINTTEIKAIERYSDFSKTYKGIEDLLENNYEK